MTLGKRIQAARKNKGLTQKQLAKILGAATGTVQQYELDKRQPRADQLRAIASALGVTVDYLLDIKPARAVDPNETEAEREKRIGLPEGALSNAPKAEDVEARNKADMMEAMDKLNISGQQEAVKRVREMASIDQYKRHSFEEIWGYSEPLQKEEPTQK